MARVILLAAALARSATALRPAVPRMASRQRPAPLRMAFTPGVDKTDEKVTIVGASGYIGKAVVLRPCLPHEQRLGAA